MSLPQLRILCKLLFGRSSWQDGLPAVVVVGVVNVVVGVVNVVVGVANVVVGVVNVVVDVVNVVGVVNVIS